MLMHEHVQLLRYPEVSNVINQAGQPIARVSMVTKLREKILFPLINVQETSWPDESWDNMEKGDFT